MAYFDGLTRDYTIDMAAADLDAGIAATNAHALKVTKAEDGILFEVPSGEFGPFELMWRDGEKDGGSGAIDGTHTDHLAKTGDVLMGAAPLAVAVVAGAVLVIVAVVLRRRSSRHEK